MFSDEQAERILSIPLVSSMQTNEIIWRGDIFGVYIAKIKYKWLITEDQNLLGNKNTFQSKDTRSYFTKKWSLKIPYKIRINLWKITNEYMPPLGNLKSRRLKEDALCPTYKEEEEAIAHLFRDCAFTKPVLQEVICYNRNKLYHKGVREWAQKVVGSIKAYISEVKQLEKLSKIKHKIGKESWEPLEGN
ncbi:hypothetical protein Golob_006004 [Gossypium lobatum]|uniref:Reverse transcriptase zinc-binding domain-containing protein n=1 Tax=Gossypium lobatum TaxID=34289 RepID=A0A7J8MV95_9ROSI|nr:hypothetical protein [Gossypium lobatum]